MIIRVHDPNFGTDIALSIYYNLLTFTYPFDDTIINFIHKSKNLFKKAIFEEINCVSHDNEITDDEKNFYLNQIELIDEKFDNDINTFIESFDHIEFEIDRVEQLEKISDIVEGIKIPIILNVVCISDDYLLKNIKNIDTRLKEKGSTNVRYIIKQCLDEFDCQNEDNSYELDDVLLVLEKINDLEQTIKKYKLSPFEQVMYTYDIVKDHLYNPPSDEDKYLESRDLARVLKSDKIVCLGFSVLFKALLDRLDITNEIIILQGINGNPGHARNMVCINDSKYNLDHILFFDSTWDCKHNEDGVIDEDRYNHFARKKLYFTKRDYNILYDNKYFPYYLKKDNNYSFITENVPKVMIQIKKIFKLINWEDYFINTNISEENLDKLLCLMSSYPVIFYKVINDYDFCLYMYKECCRMLNRQISNNDFLRCLYSVRRAENYVNPEKYHNELDRLIDIYYKYTMPEIDEDNRKKIQLFGFDNKIKNQIKTYDEIDISSSRKDLAHKLRTFNDNLDTLDIDKNISVKEALKILKK